MNAVCIIGGSGYLGQCLAKDLVRQGISTKIFDLSLPQTVQDCFPNGTLFQKGDVRILDDVKSAVRGCDTVFHFASYGMSGKAMLECQLIESINVNGTGQVIEACVAQGVPRLIYASTVNVVFGGQQIFMGKETDLDYFPLDKEYIKKGYVRATYDQNGSAEIQWLSGDNGSQAFQKAALALSKEKEHIAAGKAYFINDGPPMKSFEAVRELIEIWHPYPRLWVPWTLVYMLAFFLDYLFSILIPLEGIFGMDIQEIPITRAEVNQIGVTHTFSIERARQELGYSPTEPNHFHKIADYYRKQKEAEEMIVRKHVAGYQEITSMNRFIQVIGIGIFICSIAYSTIQVSSVALRFIYG